MQTSTVTQSGQSIIPDPLRRKLGFEQYAGVLPVDGKATRRLSEERLSDFKRQIGESRHFDRGALKRARSGEISLTVAKPKGKRPFSLDFSILSLEEKKARFPKYTLALT